jgi:hypothetical protein
LLAVFTTFLPAPAFASDSEPSAKSSSDNSSLPELGTPVRNASASIVPGPAGISAQGRFDGIKLAVTPEYSKYTGVSLGVALASMLGDKAAVGILVNGGDDKKEILVNAGFRLGHSQQLIISAGRLKQSLDFTFPSGTERVTMAQDSAGVGYQLQLGQEFLRYLEVNGYVSRTASRNLADKTFAVDTATLYELWNDPRRIAGGRISGLQGRLGFSPLPGGLVKVSLGYEHLRYDLLAGKESTHRPTTGLEWQQQLGQGYRLLLGAERFASQDRYTAGLQRSLADAGGSHSIGLNLIGVHGRNGLGNDRQVQVAYSYTFGRGAATHGTPMSAMPGNRIDNRSQPGETPASRPMSAGNLLDQVAMRPSYMPSRVVAKVDTTAAPTRLVVVDKTALPGGSSIDSTTGDVTVPLGTAVTSFAGITRNLAVFTNTGQFALGGSTLTVRPSQMVQPAAGATDSYVLSINNAGGGITSVTVLVTQGSVRIDSIVVNADSAAPTTTAAPSVSGTTHNSTTLSATINETGTGYYLVQPAAAAAPTVAAVQAGTSFAMAANVAATVNVSGLTASTDYRIYFVAKDAANNVQAVVQSVAVTTTAAPDTTAPTTTAAPSVSGTTHNSTTLSATINEAGTGYYLVQPAAAAAPTVAAVQAGTSFAMTANVAASVNVSGLTASTDYRIYFVAKDVANNVQAAVQSVALTTIAAPDTTAPTTTAAPSVSGTTYNSTTLSATINEAGTGYYLVQPAADAAPTVAAVQAGTSFAMTANVAASVNISGLFASTDYKIYFVAKDEANNVQATVQSVAFTTTAAGADTTPDAFDIPNMTDQALSTVVTTGAITVSGIDTDVTATSTVGTIVKNGSDTGSATTTVSNGDTIAIKLTTSGAYATAVNGTLDIGGVSDNFSVITLSGPEPDTTPPATPSLTINADATYTNSTVVSINITGDTDNVGVTGWYVSESSSAPDVSAGGWNVARPTTFFLSSGDGLKTLYVWTKDAAENVSNAGSNSISLDTVNPATPTLTITPPQYTNANTVSVEVNGEVGAAIWINGDNSGLFIAGDGKTVANLDTSGGDGAKNFIITLKDAAGNESAPLSVTIHKDVTAPTAMTFVSGTMPTLRITAYTNLELNLGENLTGGNVTSMTSSNGGVISNLTIVGGYIRFDWVTPNSGGSQLRAQGTDRAGNLFDITLNVTLN